MLVGRNGCGKSTLLQLIQSGSLAGWPAEIRTHLVEQSVSPSADCQTPLGLMLASKPDVVRLQAELAQLEGSLALLADTADVEKCVGRIQEIYDQLPADDESVASRILAGLGMSNETMNLTLSDLSGGWKARVALAVGVFSCPDLLLLDEPTNHLDLEAATWLATFLAREYNGTLLCVSHDRAFVNEVSTDILVMDQKRIEYFVGTLDDYEKKVSGKRKELERKLDALERQRQQAKASVQALQDEIHKRESTISVNQSRRRHASGGVSGGAREVAGSRFLAQRLRKIERMGLNTTVDNKSFKPSSKGFGMDGMNNAVTRLGVEGEEVPSLGELQPSEDLFFPAASPFHTEEPVIKLTDVCIRHGDATVMRNVDMGIVEGCRLGLVGSNGCGKSTLLKVFAGLLEPSAGRMEHQRGLRIAYIGQQDVDELCQVGCTAWQYVQQTVPSLKDHEISEVLADFGIVDESGQFISSLSGGQRMRVLLARAAAEVPHILILDEPTNHLDMFTIDALVAALQSFAGGVIFATHNRHFLEEVADEILDVSQGSLKPDAVELEPDVVHIQGLRRSNWRDG